MKRIFSVIALILLSGQVKAATCGSISIDDLIAATLNRTIAKAEECPQKEIEPEKQLVGPEECRRITLEALDDLKFDLNQDSAVLKLREVSENYNCSDDVQENARIAIVLQSEKALKAAVLGLKK